MVKSAVLDVLERLYVLPVPLYRVCVCVASLVLVVC